MSRPQDDRDYSIDEIHPPPEHLWVWPEQEPEEEVDEESMSERLSALEGKDGAS